MSDFGTDPQLPPPPAAAPPPPYGDPSASPAYGAQPASGAPPAYAYGAPGYPTPAATKPPRPAVSVGSWLLIAGGVLLILGSFLPWVKVEGKSYTGFTKDDILEVKDGPAFVFFGVLALGFGLAQLLARRVLAVAILAVVFMSFAVLGTLADYGDLGDKVDILTALGADASKGIGLVLCILGACVALGGGITTLSKRRR